ncbi:MAG: hypothetical protein MUE72_00295 [Chitinophagaceae bacterium]|jgi:hypothetical protein|nr:hypothetical protein [Chitinophagaceae bacterium]
MKKILIGSTALMVTITILVFQISCNKVDEAIDNALAFEGIFASVNGNEVKLELGAANLGVGTFTKVGTSPGISVGDVFCSDMRRIDDNTWEGIVRETEGGTFNFLTGGKIGISINDNRLYVSPNGKPTYTYTKISSAGGAGGGGTGGTGTQVLANQCVSGSNGDKKTFTFTVPANVKKLQIETFEETGCDRNAADLFVSKGSTPTITSTTPYRWVADCASIKPNRENEACVINNPGSGTWTVMLFGYNTFFNSKLKVTITK